MKWKNKKNKQGQSVVCLIPSYTYLRKYVVALSALYFSRITFEEKEGAVSKRGKNDSSAVEAGKSHCHCSYKSGLAQCKPTIDRKHRRKRHKFGVFQRPVRYQGNDLSHNGQKQAY
ncbi:hypothetical protein, unlikely [Trypanosoma brucei gambiense DAL972]|uniref:Uncharacterized protein n=1 Tax=Trypanosoma brucei gambiense (strain MHOM/CI/86/DAL972) TaxID=679716 RepID=C9ZJV4_TRYB9|nr:hypothetical protein, unlikely [Trypanosoma brucei gambiense DAL972]CBH09718.1 hypothetical protein, unlikely [Trypanosoma brucei gambiense DAL972]|eukprot:XP_011772011.1 hypothetical protein, unlikely [Trypanosoma brucei gambiense DAL972]